MRIALILSFLLPVYALGQSLTQTGLAGNAAYLGQTYVVSLTGQGTNWTGATTFSVTGGVGASITSQSVSNTYTGQITLSAGTATGTLVIHDTSDSATLSLSAVSVPSVSNVVITPDTNAVLVAYTVGPDSLCWVRFGVASGTYLWSSQTQPSNSGLPNNPNGTCSIPITGLKDGTTYYFLPTARPDPDDETNMCSTSQCGAVEYSATTPASTISHLPGSPASVASNLLSEPNTTSGYVTVALAATGAGGECAATANVNWPAGYTNTNPMITAGQTLTSIFSNYQVGFGTIFEVAQGVTCVIPSTDPIGGGYYLPALPVDPLATGSGCGSDAYSACNHRWIIIRTHQNTPADFPPFGARTDPADFSANYGGFECIQPMLSQGYQLVHSCTFENDPSPNTVPMHHVWIENLKFSVDENQTSAHFNIFMRFTGHNPQPEYIVLRGNWFHGPYRANILSGAPSVVGGFICAPTTQMAIVGNYFDNFWYTWASNAGAGQAGLPFGMYFTDPVGGPVLIDNNYLHGMAMNLYVEVNNHLLQPHDFTKTHNTLYWPYNPTFAYTIAVGSDGVRNQDEEKGMLRGLTRGNYYNGQWAGANAGISLLRAAIVDETISSNYIVNSASVINVTGDTNGVNSQPFAASANRVLVTNNVAYNLGRGLYNAGGGGIGTSVLEMYSSPDNITFQNNSIGPIDSGGFYYPWVFSNDSGTGPSSPW